jgi:hypothetical protein
MGTKVSTMKVVDTPELKTYAHYIRNFKPLTLEMLGNIRKMSDEDKMELILIYNDQIVYLSDFYIK